MKIDVRDIIFDHLSTLRDDRLNRLSLVDFSTFYVIPGILTYFLAEDVGTLAENFYGIAISVFAIFAALLFSVQVALFSINQREITNSLLPKEKSGGRTAEILRTRKTLIREVNANISYLILIASLGVAMLLAFTLTKHIAGFRTVATIYLISHFVLTIILVVVRMHTLFDEEYRR